MYSFWLTLNHWGMICTKMYQAKFLLTWGASSICSYPHNYPHFQFNPVFSRKKRKYFEIIKDRPGNQLHLNHWVTRVPINTLQEFIKICRICFFHGGILQSVWNYLSKLLYTTYTSINLVLWCLLSPISSWLPYRTVHSLLQHIFIVFFLNLTLEKWFNSFGEF